MRLRFDHQQPIAYMQRLVCALFLLPSVAMAQTPAPTIEALVHVLQGSDETAAVQAARQLGERTSESASAVPTLIAALRWEIPAEKPRSTKQFSEEVAKAAIVALGRIGEPAIGPLTKKLTATDDDAMRVNVLRSLRLIPQPDQETEAALQEWMANEDADIRREAMLTLVTIASEPERYLIDVVRQLGDSRVENRVAAIRHVDRVDPSGEKVIPFLSDI